MRVPLHLSGGRAAVQLCGLTPGQTYILLAVGATHESAVDLRMAPAASDGDAQAIAPLPGTKNAWRFTASADCTNWQIQAEGTETAADSPFFLSVQCASCPAEKSPDGILAQSTVSIQAEGFYDASTLISEVLVGNNCLDIANLNVGGYPGSRGIFSNGASSIGIADGILLCTGDVSLVNGPNSEEAASAGYGIAGYDPDLAQLTGGAQFDISTIEFDFTPSANTVQFTFVFGSEEYCQYIGTQFNDAFGFFLSGPGLTGNQNIALVPGNPPAPVSINTVNHVVNHDYYQNNNLSFYCNGLPAYNLNDCQLDGWTVPITASVAVVPCSTYHAKIAIADFGDSQNDSGVFFKAESFDANAGTVEAETEYANGQTAALEACGTNYVRFTRAGSDNSQPLPVTFSVSPASTATAGADYAALPTGVIIPAGQDELLLPVDVFVDALAEGPESIILLVDNLCACADTPVEFWIQNVAPLEVLLPDMTVCSGPVTLSPAVTGGVAPYLYDWSNTPSGSSSITPFVGVGTLQISVTVTDACGTLQVTTVKVTGVAHPVTTVSVPLCPGDSVVIDGNVYTAGPLLVQVVYPGWLCDSLVRYLISPQPQPPVQSHVVGFCAGDSVVLGGQAYYTPDTVVVHLPNAWGSCDTVATYVLKWAYPTVTQVIPLCPGSSVVIDGVAYTGPDTVVDTLPGPAGACDTILTYVLQVLPQITRNETVAFCPGDTVVIGGTAYSGPDTVSVTIPGAAGACDTLVQYALQALPYPTAFATIALCPGATTTIGGLVYGAPNTVTDTLPGLPGACDTIVTYALELLPYSTFSDTLTFCAGDSVEIGGVFYPNFGTVTDTLPGLAGACDTIVSYTLQPATPAPSTVQIGCPPSAGIEVPAGATGGVFLFDPATGLTDCICPGLAVEQNAGPASGAVFPLGASTVCYKATDHCGNSASCCFTVTVTEKEPCDVKTLGCLTWELLDIAQNAELEKTYRIRVSNACANKMAFTNIQLPDGVTAVAPLNGAIYVAPSGRSYEVRNPNLALFYSIRFNTLSDSIFGGLSDIFQYTLPAQSAPSYIHVGTRLHPRQWFEVHLNTFHCPVGSSADLSSGAAGYLRVFPNPAPGALSIDLSAWAGERVMVRVFDARGAEVLDFAVTADETPQAVSLPSIVADGMYFLEMQTQGGVRETVRFVVQR